MLVEVEPRVLCARATATGEQRLRINSLDRPFEKVDGHLELIVCSLQQVEGCGEQVMFVLAELVYRDRLPQALCSLELREEQGVRDGLRVRVRELLRFRIPEQHPSPVIGDLAYDAPLNVEGVAHFVAKQARERCEELGEPARRAWRDRFVHQEVAQQPLDLAE